MFAFVEVGPEEGFIEMLITRSRARGGSLSYLLTNNFNDMTIMMMIPQIHHARCMQQQQQQRCARECRCRRSTTEGKQHGGGWRIQMADVTTEILKHEIECMKNVLVDLFTEK